MKASQLELLEKLYQEIRIPRAVYDELTSSTAFQDEAATINNCVFIKVVDVESRQTVDVLQRATGLDLGESESIVYSDTIKADMLLMDEAAGRRVAKSMNINIIGTIGVLLAGFDEGILNADAVDKALSKLQESNRWISDSLLEFARNYIKKA
jgi:predicted nucleic acid-binding protein